MEGTSSGISADEVALYDRQIRLWGLQAQEKIRSANILLVNIKALGNEVAKNLVLAGIGSLTLVDNIVVSEEDLGSQFLLTETDIGKPRAEAALSGLQRLNPRVKIKAETKNLFDTNNLDHTFFSNFDVVIATDMTINEFDTLNALTRVSNRPFYASGSHGMYGFVFADLIEHNYVITREKSNIPTKIGPEGVTREVVSTTTKKEHGKVLELVTKREKYQPLILANTSPLSESYLSSKRRLRSVTPLLPCLRALWDFEKQFNRPPGPSQMDLQVFTKLATEKSKELQLPPETLKAEFLRSFMSNLWSEISPVCAFLGGQLAQDVINVLGGREQPIQNMLLFDGDMSAGPVYSLTPIFQA